MSDNGGTGPRRRITGIRLRAALFVIGLVAMMVFAYTWIVSPSIADGLEREEQHKLELTADIVAGQVEGTLEQAIQQLERAATLPAIETMDPAQLDPLLASLDTTTPYYLFFMVLDSEGIVRSRPSKPIRVGADRSGRAYVTTPLRTGKTHLQNIQLTHAGNLSLVVGTPIRRDGETVGILAGSLGLMDRNERLYSAVTAPVASLPTEIYLLSAEGETMATSSDPAFSKDDVIARPEMADAPVDRTALMTMEGRKWLVASREIAALGWRTVVRVPQQVVLDKVGIITGRFRLVGWISAAVVLLVGLIIAEASARPLTRLANALARYGREGAIDPIAIGGARELADAIGAFNKMVDERERADSERERLKSQLLHSQKLQTIGTLTGGIAHDFNNFLTPVLLCSQSLVRMLPEDGASHDMAESIVVSAEGARELASRLLNFGHTAENNRVPHDMSSVIGEAMALVRVSVPRSIVLVDDIDVDAGWSVVDPIQIQQMLLNFTSNGIAAMGHGSGTLTVALRCSDDDKSVILSVSDTGSGMDAEARSRIFEPFYTTKPVGEGTGLGLAVVKGIITDHEARIEIESEPGHGTRFHVYLPRIYTSPVAEEKEEAPARGRVLVVDDDSFVARAMALVLEDLGFEVQIECDSASALRNFERGQYSVDLILTDHNMPRLTGLDLARAVRKANPKQQVLIMTGRPDAALELACRKLGLLPPLPKPFAPAVLKKALDSALAS